MRLLIQPGDGVLPLVNAVNEAKEYVDIAIFRFDRKDLERALINAVSRGVQVRALIACASRGGERSLRALESRLLGAGITVGRTADDLIRYHAKYLIIDRRELFVLAFNFTYLDIEQSRSFGIVTGDKNAVSEAVKLFEMDMKRQPYAAGCDHLVVSPANARSALGEFIKGAKKELCIYDPNLSDPGMIRALEERKDCGVDVKILGRLTRRPSPLAVAKLSEMRLHTRMILRDGAQVFLGSQSLRPAELDRRREVGLVFEDAAIARKLAEVFSRDWDSAQQAKLRKDQTEEPPTTKVAKKVAKAIAKDLPAVGPLIDSIIDEMGPEKAEVVIDREDLEASVKDAVKHAVKSVVKDAVVV